MSVACAVSRTFDVMQKIYLTALFSLFVRYSTAAQAVEMPKARMDYQRACMAQHFQPDSIYSIESIDTLFRQCFCLSILSYAGRSDINTEYDIYLNEWYSSWKSMAANSCNLLNQINQKSTRVNSNEPALPGDEKLLLITHNLKPPYPYKILVVSQDSNSLLLKVTYLEEEDGKPVRKQYPLFYKGQQVGFANGAAFIVTHQQTPKGIFFSKAMQGVADVAKQYEPEPLELQMHSGDFIYLLEVQVMVERVMERK